MPGGETFIRQMQYGKATIATSSASMSPPGWLLDTFGHHAQITQLLQAGRVQVFWFPRSADVRISLPSSSGKGSTARRIPAFWLPYSYGLLRSHARARSFR